MLIKQSEGGRLCDHLSIYMKTLWWHPASLVKTLGNQEYKETSGTLSSLHHYYYLETSYLIIPGSPIKIGFKSSRAKTPLFFHIMLEALAKDIIRQEKERINIGKETKLLWLMLFTLSSDSLDFSIWTFIRELSKVMRYSVSITGPVTFMYIRSNIWECLISCGFCSNPEEDLSFISQM